MYPRVLQNLLKASTKLKGQRTLRTASLILSNVALSTQKTIPCVIPHCRVRYFSSDSDKDDDIEYFQSLPRDPSGRKLIIDEMAQKEIDKLLESNPEMEKFMKVLELEIAVRREDGERVPSELRPRDWIELIKLPGRNQRRAFLNYLFIVEKKRENSKALQLERHIQYEQIKEQRSETRNDGDTIVYGIAQNTLLRRVMEPSMNRLWNWNALRASMFGNKIVYDFSFENSMSPRELKSCAKQIMECHAINRQHNFPFEIYFCCVNFKGPLLERVHRFIPTLFDNDFPINVTSKSYLDLFDKSSIVYLTSDAQKEIDKYDPDLVYVVGAIVDRGPKQPLSLGKSKREDLQMLKLPLDSRSKFGDGSRKDLTLNAVTAIMLDAQTNDWEKALSHVPRRKLYENRIRSLEKKIQYEMYSKQCEAGDTVEHKLDFERQFPNIQTSISQSVIREKKRYPTEKSNYQETTRMFQSASAVHDFSHSARAKLKKKWNE